MFILFLKLSLESIILSGDQLLIVENTRNTLTITAVY